MIERLRANWPVLTATALIAAVASGQTAFWRMRDLGPLLWDSYAYGVNDAGWAVGVVYPPSEWRAFVWGPEGEVIDLGTLGGRGAELQGINRHGKAAGWAARTNPDHAQAFTWSAIEGVIGLDGLTPGGNCQAFSISDDGTVVGRANAADGTMHAVIWHPNAVVPTDLGRFLGSSDMYAVERNSSGQVCGTASGNAPFVQTAFLYSTGSGLQPLPPGPGSATGAYGINDAGSIAGSINLVGYTRSARWQSGTGWQLIELDDVTYSDSTAQDINNSGFICGHRAIRAGPSRATVWDALGTGTDLPTPYPLNSIAFGMSENDHVSGFAYVDPGHWRAAVWYRTTVGDTDEDCDVDLNDLARLLGSFGCCSGDSCFLQGADVSPNGCVDLNDLAILLGHFGNVCP